MRVGNGARNTGANPNQTRDDLIMADLTIPEPDADGYWHFTYITTDTLDGRWYGGKRSTKKHPLSDRCYFGSGIWIKKHPARERLKREIVAFHESSEKAYAAEAEMVTWDVILDNPLCMNRHAAHPGMTVEDGRRRSEGPWRKNQAAGMAKRSANLVWRANVVAGAKKRSANPLWQEANAAHGRRMAADPEWQEAHIAKNRLMPTDPVWCAAHAAGALRRSAKSTWRAKNIAQLNLIHAAMRGAANPNAKLSLADADAIRISPERTSILARRYSVCPSTINKIRSGRAWKPQADASLTPPSLSLAVAGAHC